MLTDKAHVDLKMFLIFSILHMAAFYPLEVIIFPILALGNISVHLNFRQET